MLDTIREQQQEVRLYEQICRSLLSQKKLNQVQHTVRCMCVVLIGVRDLLEANINCLDN